VAISVPWREATALQRAAEGKRGNCLQKPLRTFSGQRTVSVRTDAATTTILNAVRIVRIIDSVSMNSQDKQTNEARSSHRRLQGFMSNEEWEELLDYVSGLIRELDELQDEQLRKRVFELLQGIDAIHRESLTRLVRLFKEGVMEQVISDPPIHTLMELYDLLPKEDPEEQPGKGIGTSRFVDIPIKVVPKESDKADKNPPPHWVPVLASLQDIADGEVCMLAADDRYILLCRVDDNCFAIDPLCSQDVSSLRNARLSRYTLICPNHEGCYYDVRSGERVGGGPGIRGYSVRVGDDGRILIGIGVPFEPKLPAF